MRSEGKYITPWGRQCKSQMILLGKTLASLSEEVGFSKFYVSGVINGRVAGGENAVEKISRALGVSADLYSTR